MKQFCKNVIFSFVVFCLFLLILEVIMRTTHLFNARISWSEPDATYGWRFAAKAEYWNRPSEGGQSSGLINSYGWRDVEWSLNKSPDVYRVAVLGDSYVEAFQVELSETFLKIAENILLNKGYKAELMNFGRSGFTTTEELLVVRDEVLKFSPDLVVLFFYPPNDIPDVSKDLAPEKLRPFFLDDNTPSELYLDTSFTGHSSFRLKKLINPLKRNSALISLATERYQLLREKRRTKGSFDNCTIRDYLTLATSNPDPRYLQAFSLNKRLISEIVRLVKNRAEMMLVTIDTLGWKASDARCLQTTDATFNPFYYEDELRAFALSENIHYLGLQREFSRDWEKNRRELHWGHWNYEGHRLVAALLADKIAAILGSKQKYHSIVEQYKVATGERKNALSFELQTSTREPQIPTLTNSIFGRYWIATVRFAGAGGADPTEVA
jgi:hypothetical protein